jgi:transposase
MCDSGVAWYKENTMPALPIRSDLSPEELRCLAKMEPEARVARRLLALANALDEMDRATAARLAGMDRQTLRDWVIRYNDGGVTALSDDWGEGRPCRLNESQQAELKAMALAAPDPAADIISAWRVRDLCRIVEERFGVHYELSGLTRLLHALDLSWQTPRPQHPRSDPVAQEAFKKKFWRVMEKCAADHPKAKRFEVWFQDEARVGQKGRVTRRWHRRGERPRMVKDQGYRSAYIFGAVCPERDTAVALILSRASTEGMTLLLEELSSQLPPRTHALVLIDNAGWHVSDELIVPSNLTLVPLPPYSPELNAIENLWQYLRERWLSGCVFRTVEDVMDKCCEIWNALLNEPGRINSITDRDWTRGVKA